MILVLLFFTMCEKSKDSGLPTDGDGNTYDTVVIGTQVWLTENLKTTKYNNGTEVRLITDSAEWSSTTLPAYCWYKNDPAIYKNSFGALYNWYSGRLELLCPVGYHVPTMDEWLVLINTLKDASEDVKQSFKVVPVGYRTWFGSFPDGLIGDWWISSTDGSSYSVGQDFSIAGMPKRTGYSVRCIKDN
jgi:uncharacterized protein (TIGR02145 family)